MPQLWVLTISRVFVLLCHLLMSGQKLPSKSENLFSLEGCFELLNELAEIILAIYHFSSKKKTTDR